MHLRDPRALCLAERRVAEGARHALVAAPTARAAPVSARGGPAGVRAPRTSRGGPILASPAPPPRQPPAPRRGRAREPWGATGAWLGVGAAPGVEELARDAGQVVGEGARRA